MDTSPIQLFYQILQIGKQFFRADVAPVYLALALAWIATPHRQRTS